MDFWWQHLTVIEDLSKHRSPIIALLPHVSVGVFGTKMATCGAVKN
jgi:hypothetical protein